LIGAKNTEGTNAFKAQLKVLQKRIKKRRKEGSKNCIEGYEILGGWVGARGGGGGGGGVWWGYLKDL